MKPFSRGRYDVRVADSPEDQLLGQKLRYRTFLEARGHHRADGLDRDIYDETARQVLVMDREDGRCVASFRFSVFAPEELGQSYSAQWYDLSPLKLLGGQCVEIGRLCLDPDLHSPDPMRLCMAAITRVVESHNAAAMFGCASLMGTDVSKHRAVLGKLAAHIGPADLVPGKASSENIALNGYEGDMQQTLPPLLQSYLMLGGWVSDHAVIDSHFETIHVLTVVEISNIPQSRVKALRLLAQE